MSTKSRTPRYPVVVTVEVCLFASIEAQSQSEALRLAEQVFEADPGAFDYQPPPGWSTYWGARDVQLCEDGLDAAHMREPCA